MPKNMFEDPKEFQEDIAATVKALTENEEDGAEALEAFKKKYEIPAEMTKGADCAGCTSCVYCASCGISPVAGLHIGHSMYVWAFNG